MWSKRLGQLYQPPAVWVGGNRRSVTFEHQHAYEEWLKDKYKVGDVLIYKNNPGLINAQWPNVLLVLSIKEDYTELSWDYTSGMPKYAKIVSVYKNSSNSLGYNERYDEALNFRLLTLAEHQWLANDVELQACIQKNYPDFKPNIEQQGSDVLTSVGQVPV